MRVHELAKELGMSSKTVRDLLASMKIPLRSHSSTLDEATVDRVRRHVKGRAEPKPEPARVATTPSGERILGMRKIVPPPPPPEPIVADTAAGAITASETTQAKPAVPEPAVKVKPAAPEIRVVPRPATPIIEHEPDLRCCGFHFHCRLRNGRLGLDRKSTRLNSSHVRISYAVF